MSEPVNSVTKKVLQPLWNQSSWRRNNCFVYSNYSYSTIRIAGMIRIILPFRAWIVNSVTKKVLQPLWNQSSWRMNNCLAYSNYSYSRNGIDPPLPPPKKNTLDIHHAIVNNFATMMEKCCLNLSPFSFPGVVCCQPEYSAIISCSRLKVSFHRNQMYSPRTDKLIVNVFHALQLWTLYSSWCYIFSFMNRVTQNKKLQRQTEQFLGVKTQGIIALGSILHLPWSCKGALDNFLFKILFPCTGNFPRSWSYSRPLEIIQTLAKILQDPNKVRYLVILCQDLHGDHPLDKR